MRRDSAAIEEAAMAEPVRFTGTIRRWRPDQAGGLAVVDLPAEGAAALGGLRQMRVEGTLNGHKFRSNTMPAGGGVLAMSVSKAIMKSAGVALGDTVEVEIVRVP
jgi:hypothetical protein